MRIDAKGVKSLRIVRDLHMPLEISGMPLGISGSPMR